MKKLTLLLLTLLFTAPAVWAQFPTVPGRLPAPPRFNSPLPANNSPPPNNPPQDNSMQQLIPQGLINFQGVDAQQVLEVYAQLVGRTLLRGQLPSAQIILKTETPLTKAEAIQALQGVLALNNIAVINVGDKFCKVLPMDQAGTGAEPFDTNSVSSLSELGSYTTRIVQLHNVKPSAMVPIIQPFAKAPNAILPIDDNGILVLRDSVENIKRMMELIEKVDVIVPEEYISQVIPIKYAMADDIAGVLNSLETPGGGTTSFGTTSTPRMSNVGNGLANTGTGGGLGGTGGSPFGSSPFGQNGSSGYQPQQANQSGNGQSPFANRLQSILNRVQGGGGGGGAAGAPGQQPIQILGETKIIADERSNSLLVYATRQDMATITNIVAKLDVLLAQVLIESVVMEVDLNHQWNYGISAAQNQISSGNNNTIGAINNGTPFYNFVSSTATNGVWPGNFTSGALSGLSYFGNIGPNWDLALQAAASDSTTKIIQRPRIQTSQAKEAQFFVGQSVPYVTSTYYGGVGYGGPSSSYSQLQVGIALDVTPFINPDGLVVMDINQQINDISGYTAISGIGNLPNTDNRTFTSEVAVKDRDTIMLGGFTDTERDLSSSGIPILQDIPLIGRLFKSPSSNKTRDELLVLMRPTVLRTPEAASMQAVHEELRNPGVLGAERDEREIANQERKSEMKAEKNAPAVIEPSGDQPNPMYITNQLTNPGP